MGSKCIQAVLLTVAGTTVRGTGHMLQGDEEAKKGDDHERRSMSSPTLGEELHLQSAPHSWVLRSRGWYLMGVCAQRRVHSVPELSSTGWNSAPCQLVLPVVTGNELIYFPTHIGALGRSPYTEEKGCN